MDLSVPAVKGRAVLWPSVTNLDPSRDEPKTFHEAMPVEVGVKYASNVWIHNYDYRAVGSQLPAHAQEHALIHGTGGEVRWRFLD